MVKNIGEAHTLMSTTRILWTLLVTGTLAVAATGTPAQSIAQPGQSQELQDPRSVENGRQGRPWDIVGSWFATTSTGLKQLYTFHADGTAFACEVWFSTPDGFLRFCKSPHANVVTVDQCGTRIVQAG